MAISGDDERRLRRNWTLLKTELPVEALVHRLVDEGVLGPTQRSEITNVLPNTPSMRAEKFLNAVIQSGSPGYQALCRFLTEQTDNRFARVTEALGIAGNHGNNAPTGRPVTGNNAQHPADSRPSTATSSGTINSETGEKHRRHLQTFRSDDSPHNVMGQAPVATVAPQPAVHVPVSNASAPPVVTSQQSSMGAESASSTPQALFIESRMAAGSEASSGRASQSTISLSSFNSESTEEFGSAANTPQQASVCGEREAAVTPNNTGSGTSETKGSDTPMDMKVLEQELVRIAPTIRDLFKKIHQQTTGGLPTSDEELQKVKEENERLRKTNKSLIEKLNAFQQKIIQLQLDNKRLKENSEAGRVRGDELQQKAVELKSMERRLEEHRAALEEKEAELNSQLRKLEEIEEENAAQREKIDKLEELQDEGIMERNLQQEQISTLVEEKERQRDQIDALEEMQRAGESRLVSLEERLMNLEQAPRRPGRQRRVMSPPRSHWMNGIMDRSHHANVKYQSEIKFDPQRNGSKKTSTTGKAGWPFI
ncbi:hypothetical protein MAR_001331 [Mya arenaria]|uniref:CARD domain-containing protein n=1 Tax=Mya arenaria TaxID=6604 RepID=A0ABY7FFJ6_MYAAR|nr:translation initiation factor IF-2-like [Mya arenaria]WAR19493.1 hypothetical protein MAR_001331 [Mya arenaria]